MGNEREAQFRQLVVDYPDSPMGHFSLGKLYLDEKRYAEAARSLEEAVRLDGDYAAAFVALADAYSGLGDPAQARGALERAKRTPLGQRDASLVEDIDARLAELG